MRYSMLVATVLVMLICGPVAAEELTPFRGERTLTVMTQNVYHGVNAELYGVATATDFRDLLIKVAAVFNGYHTRNFPERRSAGTRSCPARSASTFAIPIAR